MTQQSEVVVPREPTEAMLDAGFKAYNDSEGSYRALYRAMLAAAPALPAAAEPPPLKDLEGGGHIVWWKEGGVSYYPKGEAFSVDRSCRVDPLVTRASAEAVLSSPRPADDWSELSCDDQFALATRIAANIGYELKPEPEHPDSPHARPAGDEGGERAVMVCPQCEGGGEYADGVDEAACSTPCTRCAGNGWLVDLAALAARPSEPRSAGAVDREQITETILSFDLATDWPTQKAEDLADAILRLSSGPDEGEGKPTTKLSGISGELK